jgi:hypothetical protein
MEQIKNFSTFESWFTPEKLIKISATLATKWLPLPKSPIQTDGDKIQIS